MSPTTSGSGWRRVAKDVRRESVVADAAAEKLQTRDRWAASRQGCASGTTDPPGSTDRRPGGPFCCAPTKRQQRRRLLRRSCTKPSLLNARSTPGQARACRQRRRAAALHRMRGGWAASRQGFAPGTTNTPGSTNRRPGGPSCCAPTRKNRRGCAPGTTDSPGSLDLPSAIDLPSATNRSLGSRLCVASGAQSCVDLGAV